MSAYVVTIPGDESVWAARTDEDNHAVAAAHSAFYSALVERGHTVVASHELAHSREAKVARLTPDGVQVTDGPYAESVEQIGGLYVVETSDPDDLLSLAAELARTERAVEVRPTVDHSGDMP